jgi:hypothetical protein
MVEPRDVLLISTASALIVNPMYDAVPNESHLHSDMQDDDDNNNGDNNDNDERTDARMGYLQIGTDDGDAPSFAC